MPRNQNQFDKFKATKTKPSSGWLSTKKRGRDDAQIEHDREAVLQERKKSRSRTKGVSQRNVGRKRNTASKSKSNATKSKSKAKRSARSNKYSSDEDDMDDDDSFIVHSSDEEVGGKIVDSEFEEEEEEEEEVWTDSYIEEDDDDDSDGIIEMLKDEDEDEGDDDDDDDDLESLEVINSPPNKKAASTRRGPRRLQRGRVEENDRYDDKKKKTLGQSKQRNRRTKGRVTPQDDHGNISDSSPVVDQLDVIETPQKEKNKENRAKSKKGKINKKSSSNVILSLSSSDEDDDVLFYSLSSTSTKTKAATKKSKNAVPSSVASSSPYFSSTKKNSTAENVVSSPLYTNKRSKKKTLPFTDDDDDDDDENCDGQKNNKNTFTSNKIHRKDESKKKLKKRKNQIFLSDTDENDDENDNDNDGFDQDDQDEAIALSLALEASRKEAQNNPTNNKKQMPPGKKAAKPKMIYKDDLQGDNDENNNEESDEDDGAEVDAYESPDEDELQANNVLDAANKLSSHIVSELQSWCTSDNNATKGLIVNGALAVGSINTNKKVEVSEEKKSEEEDNNSAVSTRKSTQWISNEKMSEVCPNIVLKDYQLIGVNWMALLHSLKFEVKTDNSAKSKRKSGARNVNGVLADEMGLGKTAQTIAFLAWLKHHSNETSKESDYVNTNSDTCNDSSDNEYKKPHIIIVPASVLSNWEREFNKFCPTMNVIRYHGTLSERKELKTRLREYLPKKKGPSKGLSDLDVVLTTFSYFSSEKADDRNFLRKFDWNYMVVDEAHCLKNPKGARYRNMDKFNTRRRLLLTGTPIQNSAKELMSLLCFLMPLFTKEASGFDDDDGNDGGARMLEHFVRTEHLKDNNINSDKQITQEQAYAKLKQLLAPFVLRRSKIDVLPQWLPPKKRQIEWVPFDEKIRDVYNSILHKHLAQKDNGGTAQTHIFTDLRKAANHPLLLRTRHINDEEIDHLSKHLFMYGYFGEHETCNQSLVKKELKKFSDYDIHCAAQMLIDENTLRSKELERYTLQENDLFCSPKFNRLRKLLPELINAGHRLLIFSQWTRCLDLLGCLMNTLCLSYLRLDGQTSINERQGLIDQFTDDTSISVFLLSTRAGGMGINLTAADTCILHDLDFNPFNDIQAEDRCHRIGQKKPVTIIKMITEETVDSDIYKMQERKSQMNQAILDSNSNTKKKQETEEMSHILEMAVSRYQDRK